MTLDALFRALPYDFKGKHRLARLLWSKKIRNQKNILVETDNGAYELPNLAEPVAFSIFINGCFEKSVADFINSRTRGKKAFIDIGANIGSIAIPVAKSNPDLTVYCIEASPRIFSYLRKNQLMNAVPLLHVFNFAISDESVAEVSFFSPEEGFGRGSLSPVFTKVPEMVEAITLDKFVNEFEIEPDFIKIDIEGYENQAFIGGKGVLQKKGAPDILFEVCDWAENLAGNSRGDSQRTLLDYGYKLFMLDGKKLVPLKKIIDAGFAMVYATKSS